MNMHRLLFLITIISLPFVSGCGKAASTSSTPSANQSQGITFQPSNETPVGRFAASALSPTDKVAPLPQNEIIALSEFNTPSLAPNSIHSLSFGPRAIRPLDPNPITDEEEFIDYRPENNLFHTREHVRRTYTTSPDKLSEIYIADYDYSIVTSNRFSSHFERTVITTSTYSTSNLSQRSESKISQTTSTQVKYAQIFIYKTDPSLQDSNSDPGFLQLTFVNASELEVLDLRSKTFTSTMSYPGQLRVTDKISGERYTYNLILTGTASGTVEQVINSKGDASTNKTYLNSFSSAKLYKNDVVVGVLKIVQGQASLQIQINIFNELGQVVKIDEYVVNK